MAQNVKKYSIRKNSNEEDLFLHEIMERCADPTLWILDLGAGEGTFDYKSYKSKIAAVDEEIPRNIKQISQSAYFVQCDAAALSFLPNTFDIILANFVFEHFAMPEAVLKGIESALRPGGLLYLSLPNSASLEDRLFKFMGGDKYHIQNYSFQSLMRMVYKATNLKLISFAEWPAGYTWLNGEPSGRIIRRIVLRFLKFIRPFLQKYARRDSGFICLFKREGQLGFRCVTHVCRYCGSGATVEEDVDRWMCAQCGHENS